MLYERICIMGSRVCACRAASRSYNVRGIVQYGWERARELFLQPSPSVQRLMTILFYTSRLGA